MAYRPKPPGARKRPRRGLREPASYHKQPSALVPGLRPLDACFEQSAASISQAPPDTGREVAFAGRSNSGKSSALNCLTNRRGLARTSRTPGRTQLMNFFLLNQTSPADLPRRLVDLPGYGFAQTDRATRNAWQRHVEDYLAQRRALTGLVLLMDVRHPFQPLDEQLLAWTEASAMPVLILLNKADKLSRSATIGALQEARSRLSSLPAAQPLLFSARRGTGAQAVLEILRAWLELLPTTGSLQQP